MKSILKVLILAAIPMLAVTAVADQGLAADKGSQLIFQSNMAHKNFISVANTASNKAVTVLFQYYNDEMKLALWFLRVIPAGGNVLVDPFDHMIPGTGDEDGMNYTSVSDVLSDLPAMSTDDEAGMNSGRFVIAVTAVGANSVDDDGDTNTASTANILFPGFLAENMHGMDNIDNCGVISSDNIGLGYTRNGSDGVFDCRKDDPGTADTNESDQTSKNVGNLGVANAEPIGFDHLTGHFTEALISTAAGGSDQTASWGGTPIVREALASDYTTLNGEEDAMLAEKSAGGTEEILSNTVAGYTGDKSGKNRDSMNRALSDGALVLPALHGGSMDMTHQVIQFLSVADDFGGAGKYMLIPAKTKYKVTLHDNMGDALPDPASASGPVFGGGADDPETPASVSIIVEGIQVMTNAGDCGGDMIDGAWTLAHLTELVPTAASGANDFAGLDAMIDPMMNASPGLIKFMRTSLKCEMDYGDGDAASGSTVEEDDDVPVKDEREYVAGTLIVEEMDSMRTFVTTGRAVLKFITPESTFGASWSLKSPRKNDSDL